MRFAPRILSLAVLVCTLAQPAFAQKVKAGVTEEILTPQRVRLALTYWESPEGQESPLIVLLHGEKGNRKKWESMAKQFQASGYAVIALDLRKHGDSAGAPTDAADGKSDDEFKLKTIDYIAMAADDMDGLKAYIYQKHQARELNMRKTGIVGVGPTCHVAILAAARDWVRAPHPDGSTLSSRTPRGQDVQTLALISPESSLKGIKLNEPVGLLKSQGVAFYVIVGGKDEKKRKAADRMNKLLTSRLKEDDAKARIFYYHPKEVKLNGENLLRKYEKGMFEKLKQFHDLKLKSVQQPWRDRQSRLEK